MTAFIALLRAVNVGGSNVVAMTDLKRLCEEAGFEAVKTYIASGNVIFRSSLGEAKVKAELEKRLVGHGGKAIAVFVRTATELGEVVKRNPFGREPGNRVMAFFFDKAHSIQASELGGPDGERVKSGKREIYVFYPNGMGRSKLKLPVAEEGTARNMNTVAKLTEMAAAI